MNYTLRGGLRYAGDYADVLRKLAPARNTGSAQSVAGAKGGPYVAGILNGRTGLIAGLGQHYCGGLLRGRNSVF
jgi:hypothetical protein